jgi:hypothetical protein
LFPSHVTLDIQTVRLAGIPSNLVARGTVPGNR